MSAEMQGLVLRTFTLAQFQDYLKAEVAPNMKAWRPSMIVLHEAGPMVWPGFDSRGVKITPIQRVKNVSVTWVNAGFQRAPHLFLGYEDGAAEATVTVCWPLTEHGTHAPSWNNVSWGIEQAGDFTKNAYPPQMQTLAVGVMKALYGMIGLPINGDTFKLHKEDPKTTHKLCPGVRCGDKATWLARLNSSSNTSPVAEISHHENLTFSLGMKAKLKSMEAFRDKAYNLKGIWHVGWGFRDGFKGLKVDASTTMTLAVADALFEKSTDELADTIQMFVHVPLKQYQLDALGLIAWNIGTTALEGSTIVKRLNAEDIAGAGAAFDLWNKWRPTPGAPLEVSPQLSARRSYERAVFEGRIDLTSPPVLVATPAQPPAKPLVVVAAPPKATVTAPTAGAAPMAPKTPAKAIVIPAPKPGLIAQIITAIENLILAFESKDKPAAGGPR